MKKLLWLPIDLPKLPDITNLMIGNNKVEEFAYWQFIRLTEANSSPYKISQWRSEIVEKYPELITWFELFPFKNLRNIKLNRQMTSVKAHNDFTQPEQNLPLWHNNHSNEPCGYRVLVCGKRSNCLWVEQSNGNRIHCTMPIDTDVYVLNHTVGIHGVEDDNDRWTIFTHGEIDSLLHTVIIKRSLEKYANLAVWDI
jgi:hypothetical protein